MKFTEKTVITEVNILANDHYVAIPYDCTELTTLATDGIIKAGTVIPANDATAKGVLLTDVNLNENPNGTIVIHGFIKKDKMPIAPDTTAITALSQVMFM
ncbi:MAG: hypothetical protein ACI4XP_03235 [Acutalibacteraceae bacterium]